MSDCAVKWIKISTSMFDDEKIRYLEQMPEADSILAIWVKLLVLAGQKNAAVKLISTTRCLTPMKCWLQSFIAKSIRCDWRSRPSRSSG